MDAQPVLDRVTALRSAHDLVLVGIGGHGCAGKTTLARLLPATAIVSTDEFWDGAGFDLGRVRREVLDPLVERRPARFASFDWEHRQPRGEREVAAAGVVVVEGVCALHESFRSDYHLRVWVDAPRELRLARAVAREGETARAAWEGVWLPREERYVAADDPVSAADLVVDGAG
jgi:uridine kinase